MNDAQAETRDIADVPAVELINTVAVHLMSAAAVKLGLGGTAEIVTGQESVLSILLNRIRQTISLG